MKQINIKFEKGKPINIDLLNILSNRVTELISIVNFLLKDRININIEVLGTTQGISFSQAIELVPSDRRVSGITIKYNDINNGWSTYVWTGDTWLSERSWTKIEGAADIIDGGQI